MIYYLINPTAMQQQKNTLSEDSVSIAKLWNYRLALAFSHRAVKAAAS